MQSQHVATALEQLHPTVRVELVLIKTTGDVITDRPLHDAGGKGLFTKEIELALLRDEIDFAVHSYKDVPVTMPLVDTSDLIMAATPDREDPRDVLISPHAKSIHDLPPNAKVGTGSLRRRCQLLDFRPDLDVQLIRGNVDTRLRKLRDGQYHAILLAHAGLRRSALFDAHDMTLLDADDFLPAAGQGALALQCRRADTPTRDLLAALHDLRTETCVNLERSVVQALDGDCHSPIAALATLDDDQLTLRAAVGKAGGSPPLLRASATGPAIHPTALLQTVIADLDRQGARTLLNPPPTPDN
jgi:hydroxymethylbilane synthase